LGYRPRQTGPRNSRGTMEKTKPKGKIQKRETARGRIYEQEVLNSSRIIDKAVEGMRSLGNQRFVLPPFSEHFERWFLSLETILSDFRSSPAVTVDDQFLEESNRVLSDTRSILKDTRKREDSNREIMVAQLDARSLLLRAERDFTTELQKLENEEVDKTGPLSNELKSLNEKLKSIIRMKAGFLRGISKEEKTRREAQIKQRLEIAETELKELTISFKVRQEALRIEYEKRRKELLAQIEKQRQAESPETSVEVDPTVNTRRSTCNALIEAIRKLAERNTHANLQQTSSQHV